MEGRMSNELANANKDTLQNATLADIEVGGSCVIVESLLPSKVKARFAEMGLVPDTEVSVLLVAPLGDPIEVRVRGYSLCLRKEILRGFAVSPTKHE